MTIPHMPLRALAAITLACVALALAAASASAALPDPMARGHYGVETMKTFLGGTVQLQEPNASGGAPTGSASAVTLQLRGSAYYPSDRTTPSPVIVLVHGNHGSCDPGGGSSPFCNDFRRNDEGYAYMGENLASHGYTVLSLDQDQLMAFQDGRASGMHQRRLYIAAALDMLYAANKDELPTDANTNIGDRFVGRLDMRRVGLMGHSRGGDAVTSFIDYNRTRPAPGRRYNLRGVIALAPVDYERRAPYGTPHLSILPYCDGDVSNLQGARFYERGQYAMPGDPFPRIQQSVLGGNHNWFNTNWATDADDAAGSATDPACGTTQPNNIRLTRGAYTNGTGGTVDNRGSGDPALMGDQAKVGLATHAAFFRRYVGGEVAFDPYMTGELSAVGAGEQLPISACPTDPSGTRIPCAERISTAYFPAAAERRDVIGPDPDTPLTASWLGTAITAAGFAYPYTADGGVQPLPPATASGIDWCNPEPDHFTPGNIGFPGIPTARKGCPLPGETALGGQRGSGVREAAPVNRSYGLQLAVAWENPLAATGAPATIATRIPAASGDVSGFEALALGAAVNFFDPRNPARDGDALWNTGLTTQDFTIALTDAAGTTATVAAGDHRYGNALHQTTGTNTPRVHIVLGQIRVPLADFAAQGVDLTTLRRLELRFGEAGKPATGSIQLADVRFQEAAGGPTVLGDGPAAAGAPAPGVQPIDLVEPVARVSVEEAGQATAAVAAPAVAPPSPTACVDRTAPTVKLGRRTRRALRGTAADRGCGARVAAVQVSLARAAGKGRLRFVKASGRLTKPLARTASVALVAKGTTRWTLTLPRRLAKGRYLVTVRALDAAGNVSAKPVRSTITVR